MKLNKIILKKLTITLLPLLVFLSLAFVSGVDTCMTGPSFGDFTHNPSHC